MGHRLSDRGGLSCRGGVLLRRRNDHRYLGRAIGRRFPTLHQMRVARLHLAQANWHRQWADSYDEWRRSQDMSPLEPGEWQWPIALPPDDADRLAMPA